MALSLLHAQLLLFCRALAIWLTGAMLRSNPPVLPSKRPRVFVYRGEGAGWRSVKSTCESLQRLLPQHFKVSTLSAAELLDGSWVSHAALLVMPGGADLPYCKHLNGKGNSMIRKYVQSGGSYLGLCAGAYYACSRVEFEAGSALEVVGDRELGFFPGIARGAAYPGFDYMTEAGAAAAHVHFRIPAVLIDQAQQLQQPSNDVTRQQAAACCGPQQWNHLQQGVDSGAMIQQQPSNGAPVWCTTRDYCNGGPIFISKGGSLDLSTLPGVVVLATYSQLPPESFVHGSATVQEGIDPFKEEQQQSDDGFKQQDSNSRLGQTHTSDGACLIGKCATAASSQPAAAVRCQVGQGVAVLCGTHPELGANWVDVCGRSHEQVKSAAPAAEQPGAVGDRVEESVPSGPSSDAQQDATAIATCTTPAEAAAAGLRPLTAADSGGTVLGSGISVPAVAMLAGAVMSQHQTVSSRDVQCQGVHMGQGGGGNNSAAGTGIGSGDSSAASTDSEVQCDNAALQAHTAELKATLSAYQHRRDLLMSCLLYEALSSVKSSGAPSQ